jgi:hypothetical protein
MLPGLCPFRNVDRHPELLESGIAQLYSVS